jgi:ABC-type branched-subunit amino acid transport system permease subunit
MACKASIPGSCWAISASICTGYAAVQLCACCTICAVPVRATDYPFAVRLSLRGIRENLIRMPAIGAPSRAHIRTIYTIAAAIAGVAGAVLAQTTETVSLDSLGFERSAEVVVMLVLGGTGRLYGGLVGAIIYMVARDQFSGVVPQYWYFWIGILLVAVVVFLPNGLSLAASQRSRRAGAPVSAPALSTRGLAKKFGSLVVASDIEIELPQGVRLRADRP